jgi:hypothetical protein
MFVEMGVEPKTTWNETHQDATVQNLIQWPAEDYTIEYREEEGFSPWPLRPERLWVPFTLSPIGTGVNRPGPEADRSPCSNIKCWSFASSPPDAFMVRCLREHRDNSNIIFHRLNEHVTVNRINSYIRKRLKVPYNLGYSSNSSTNKTKIIWREW